MSLKADVLKTNPNKLKAINKEVLGILAGIDDEIKAAYDKEDKGNAIVTLPITFSIPYMSNKNAQRAIYYKVLESLLGRGFEVDIYMAEDKTTFHIKWLSKEEEDDIGLQNNLLAKHTKAIKKTQSKDNHK